MKKIAAMAALVGVVMVVLIGGVPSFQGNCPLPRANAQDNPCLVQEATLSAMENQVLRAERDRDNDRDNYQSTIAALETRVANAGTREPGEFPIREDFNNNDRGWQLTGNNYGIAQISGGNLTMTNSGQSYFTMLVPGVEVPDTFYVEAAVNTSIVSPGIYALGYWIGDYNSNQFHIFNIGSNPAGDGILLIDGLTVLQRNTIDTFTAFTRGQPIVGLEVVEGQYSFYVNDDLVLAGEFTRHGNQIGIFVSYQQRLTVDYLVIRDER